MRHARTAAGVLGVLLALAGCSSSRSTPSSAPPSTSTASSQPAAPAETCATPLPDRGDIIVWSKAPGLPDSAQQLGGTDPEHCVLTFDYLKQTSPTGAGYCTEAAWASDNPGYNADAKPAPRPKKIQVTIGDCG